MAESVKQTKLPMACRCGADNRAIYNLMRQQVHEALWEDIAEPPPMDGEDFVSQIVFAFQHDLKGGFHIGSVFADQWIGLRVIGKDEEVYIECDLLEDGLATVYLYVLANYGRLDDA